MQQLTLNQDVNKADVISAINDGSMVLSYSSIKEFAKSPSHFIRYKTRKKEDTPAMRKGRLIHCAILEPEELENRFMVLLKKDMPVPDADFRNAENKAWKKRMEDEAAAFGREIVDPSEWEIAERHREVAFSNQIVTPYLMKLERAEVKIDWEFGGFRWTGYVDGIGPSYQMDLKTVDDASPERLKWKLFGDKYHWQHFLYRQSEDIPGYFAAFNLLIDANMGMSLLKVQDHQIDMAQNQIEGILERFRMCRDNGLWDMNYEFWADSNQGYFTID